MRNLFRCWRDPFVPWFRPVHWCKPDYQTLMYPPGKISLGIFRFWQNIFEWHWCNLMGYVNIVHIYIVHVLSFWKANLSYPYFYHKYIDIELNYIYVHIDLRFILCKGIITIYNLPRFGRTDLNMSVYPVLAALASYNRFVLKQF